MCDATVRYNPIVEKKEDGLGAKVLKKRISNLHPYSHYEFCVEGYTLAGVGGRSCQDIKTGLAGIIEKFNPLIFGYYLLFRKAIYDFPQ